MKSKKLAVIAIATGAALVAGTGATYAASRQQNAPQSSQRTTRVAHDSVLDVSKEAKFVALNPCRVVDTRKAAAGVVSSGVKRDFFIGGTTGFQPQGGTTGGCNIPADATGAAITVTMVEASANGFVHLWPKDATEPGASFLNFARSYNVSASGVTKLGTGGAISFKALGAKSHVVIDVTGYYIKPLWASVSSGGTLLSSSRGVSVTYPQDVTASYGVIFDRNVQACSYEVTGSTFGDYTYVAQPLGANANGVYVASYKAGTLTASSFYVTVTC